MFFNNFGIKSINIPLIYFPKILGGMLFFLPILALYYEQNLFTITNVALIFSIGAIALAIFEVPTGAIADLFGRKKTLVLAYFIVILAVAFLYIGGNMTMFVLYAVLNAFAMSLASGTDSALIYDTLKEENKEHYYKKIIGTYQALWPIGASIGSIIGGYLATTSLSFPILTTFIPLSVAFILTLFLKEPNYKKEQHKNIFKHMFYSSKLIIKNKQLVILLLGSFILWAFGESAHLLKPLFLEFKEIPIVYFGYVFAFVFGFSSLGHYLSHNVSEKLGSKTTLILCVFLFPLFQFIAAITTKLTSIIFLVSTSIFFGLRNPIMDNLLNLEVDSGKRATILSTASFMRQLGLAIFAPFIGYIAEIYTINTAYKISALLMFIVTILFLFLKNKE